MNETQRKKIVLMVDNINDDLIKICFCDCELCTSIKITQNLSNKPMSKVTTKLGEVHMDFLKLSPSIFLEKDQYIWIVTN